MAAVRTYDAFGNIVSNHASWQGPFGYAGGFGYQEDATGLRLLGHRYYDPSIGRFLTRDPIKDGRNWYGYGGGHGAPTGFADPTGLIIFPAIVIAVAAYYLIKTGVEIWRDTTTAVIIAEGREHTRMMVQEHPVGADPEWQTTDWGDRGDSAVTGGGAAWRAGMSYNIEVMSAAAAIAGGGNGLPFPTNPPGTAGGATSEATGIIVQEETKDQFKNQLWDRVTNQPR